MYVQVFFLLTFFEKHRKILIRKHAIKLENYPSVTIIVPCYNEETTVVKTVKSLLALEYPRNKLKIIVVDDGSKDNTWKVIQQFKKNTQIEIFRKENGGKHTAVNFALERITTDLVGGLDADSFVDSEALKRIITYFDNPETMAVAPSIMVHRPKNILQKAQKAEYDMAVFNKKMLAFMGGIHVTPGPFSIFRKKVFDDLGPYRKAHNTEDQEIALRMQAAGYKIEHCPDAYVYTMSPNTIPQLYRQRLRWIYGFIKNAFDYRRLLFKKRYGNVALFTLPSGIISVISVVFLFAFIIYNFFNFINHKVLQVQTIGFGSFFHNISFDWFFIDTKVIMFVSVILYGMVVTALLLGRRMAEGRIRFSFDILYFVVIYSLIAPFWVFKAIYNAIRSRESSWTFERRVKT
ncbi:MAG: glycosyltransferase family 2 protein [Candidatus Paceibacterota bacterium]|jgi:cellulose synthase/poly-beta-1,6-N-acetylglucosamine synthase-like glycosyltransferase